MRPWGRRAGWVVAAVLALAVAVLASVAFGARAVAWPQVVSALVGGEVTAGEATTAGNSTGETAFARAAIQQRIPRTVLAVLVGAALAVAGVVLQGLTRNPLADPGMLGISPGAALAVVAGIAFFDLRSTTSYLWVAIVGAALAAVFVAAVAGMGRGGATPLKLALAGAVTWASCSAATSAILLPRIDVMNEFRFWQIGGVGGADASRIATVLPFLAVGLVVALGCARGLNSLALGDDVAAGLGQNVARTRLVAGGGAVVLCGAATAVAGPIAFVGLAVPHLCRLLVGAEHRWLVPFSALAGASLLTIADVAGRVVARPEEIDVGVVMAFVGAPVFIAVVRRQKVRAL